MLSQLTTLKELFKLLVGDGGAHDAYLLGSKTAEHCSPYTVTTIAQNKAFTSRISLATLESQAIPPIVEQSWIGSGTESTGCR